MDYLVVALVLVIMVVCMANVLGYGVYMQVQTSTSYAYLPFITPKKTPVDTMLSLWVTSIILFNGLIPYSMTAVLDFSRWMHARQLVSMISEDKRLEETSGHGGVEHSPLPTAVNDVTAFDSLGKVGFIVMDKTDTLTSNKMTLKGLLVAVKGSPIISLDSSSASGDTPADFALRGIGTVGVSELSNLLSVDSGRSAADARTARLLLLNLALCHEAVVPSVPVESPFSNHRNIPPTQDYFSPYNEEEAILTGLKSTGFGTVLAMKKDVSPLPPSTTSPEVSLYAARRSMQVRVRPGMDPEEHTIIAINAFSHSRRRSSVVSRGPDGALWLWVKGSVQTILHLLKNEELVAGDMLSSYVSILEKENILSYHGLRTMLCAGRPLSETDLDEYWEHRSRGGTAFTDFLFNFETSLDLYGCVAFENHLMPGVKDAVDTFFAAGIRLAMCTGDSTRTSISVALSAGLGHQQCDVVELKGESREEILGNILDASNALKAKNSWSPGTMNPNLVLALEASTLETLLGKKTLDSLVLRNPGIISLVRRSSERAWDALKTYLFKSEAFNTSKATKLANKKDSTSLSDRAYEELEEKDSAALETFLEFAFQSRSLIICSASPSDKARVVRLLRWTQLENKSLSILAVGDGPNDIPMFEEADVAVGVGIPQRAAGGMASSEARQCAAISISQFKDLLPIVLHLGRESQGRLTLAALLMIYSNFVIEILQWAYSTFAMWSAVNIFDSYLMSAWNLLFTLCPVLYVAVMDVSAPPSFSLRFPSLYGEGIRKNSLSIDRIASWLACGFRHAVSIWVIIYFLRFLGKSHGGYSMQIVDSPVIMGCGILFAVLIVVLGRISLSAHSTGPVAIAVTVFSIVIYIVYVHMYSQLASYPGYFSAHGAGNFFGTSKVLFGSSNFWLGSLFLLPAVCLLPDLLFTWLLRRYMPQNLHAIQEWIEGYGTPLPHGKGLTQEKELMRHEFSLIGGDDDALKRGGNSDDDITAEELHLKVLVSYKAHKSRRMSSTNAGDTGTGPLLNELGSATKGVPPFGLKSSPGDVNDEPQVLWKGSKKTSSEISDPSVSAVLRGLQTLIKNANTKVKLMHSALLLSAERSVLSVSSTVGSEKSVSPATPLSDADKGDSTKSQTLAPPARRVASKKLVSLTGSLPPSSWVPSDEPLFRLLDEEDRVSRSVAYKRARRMSENFRQFLSKPFSCLCASRSGTKSNASVAPLPSSEIIRDAETPAPVVLTMSFQSRQALLNDADSIMDEGTNAGLPASEKQFSYVTMKFFDPQLEKLYVFNYIRNSSRALRTAIGLVVLFGLGFLASSTTKWDSTQLGVTAFGIVVCFLFVALTCLDVFRHPIVYYSSTIIAVFIAGVAKTAITVTQLSITPEVLFQICIPMVLRLPFYQSLLLCIVDLFVWTVWTSRLENGENGAILLIQKYFIHINFIMVYCFAASYSLQIAMRENFVRESQLLAIDEKSTALLGAMLPRHVTAELRRAGGSKKASDLCFYEPCVTVMFIQIVDFDVFVAKHPASALVAIMDKLWGLMDELAERHGVTKLETVGKEFVACCGLNGERKDHASACVSMGLDAIQAARMLHSGIGDPPFELRVGVNTGSMVAGIVGRTRPQFCCVGDVMNTAARVAYFGKNMHVNIHENTFRRIGKRFLCRDNMVVLKSKGLLNVRWVEGRMSESVWGEKVDAQPPSTPNNSPQNKRHPSLTPQSAAVFQRSELTQPVSPNEDESGLEASDALLLNLVHAQAESRLHKEMRVGRQTKEVRLDIFSLTFLNPALEGKWSTYITRKRLPLIRYSLVLLSVFSMYRLLNIVAVYASKKLEKDTRPTFKESTGRAANFSLSLFFLAITYLGLFKRSYPSVKKSSAATSKRASAAASAATTTSQWEKGLWDKWGKLIQAYGPFVQLVITAACFNQSAYNHEEGSPDVVFFFTLCCNSGVLSWPQGLLLTFSYFITWELGDSSLIASDLAALAMGYFSQITVELYERHSFGVAELTKEEVSANALLLNNMLPRAVAEKMTTVGGGGRITDTFNDVCIMYADVSGFTRMSSVLKPKQVIDIINKLFFAYEAAAIRNGVFKVQTIGDCLVVVAGMPYVDAPWDTDNEDAEVEAQGAAASNSLGGSQKGPTSSSAYEFLFSGSSTMTPTLPGSTKNPSSQAPPPPSTPPVPSSPSSSSPASSPVYKTFEAEIAARLPAWAALSSTASLYTTPRQRNAAKMLRLALEMCVIMDYMEPPPGVPRLGVRIGLHTGSIIGGVIGSKAFRYDIFGVDVLTANTMESSGCPGAVLLSDTAWEALRDLQSTKFPIPGLDFVPRGPIALQGEKEIFTAFADVPGCRMPDEAREMFGKKGVHEAGYPAPTATTTTVSPQQPPASQHTITASAPPLEVINTPVADLAPTAPVAPHLVEEPPTPLPQSAVSLEQEPPPPLPQAGHMPDEAPTSREISVHEASHPAPTATTISSQEVMNPEAALAQTTPIESHYVDHVEEPPPPLPQSRVNLVEPPHSQPKTGGGAPESPHKGRHRQPVKKANPLPLQKRK